MTTTPRARRLALILMLVGLALTLLAVVVPFLAPHVLEDHIRKGYPDYTAAELDDVVNGWLMILATFGALGALGWTVSMAATVKDVRPRLWASLACGFGLALSLTAALAPEESGDVGLAPAYGALLMLPCVAGVAAVVVLWRSGGAGPAGAGEEPSSVSAPRRASSDR